MRKTVGYFSYNMLKPNSIYWFLIRALLVAASVLLHQLFFPWWGTLIACFIAGFFTHNMNKSPYWTGFTGVFLVWSSYAGIIDFQTNSILSGKIMQLFYMPANSILAVLLTGVIGGIPGGFACKAGDLFREMILKRNKFH